MNDATQWPPSAEALADTTLCPSCFTTLVGLTCPNCGLRLDTAAAELLLEHVRHMIGDDRRRHALVAEIRVENAQVDETRRINAQRAEAARAALEQQRELREQKKQRQGDLPQYRPAFARGGDTQGAAAPVRRRSTVQILLLSIGIVLVSVTAIFFALIAFLITSASVRAVLLLGVVALVFATARGLQRRLPTTAEGIAVLAIVLLALDGLLVRAQHLFASGSISVWLFTGLYAALMAVVLELVGRRSTLRAFRLGALLLAPVATWGIGAGLATAQGAPTSIWAGATLTAVAGLALARFTRSPFEITWVRAITTLALLVATVAGLFTATGIAFGGAVALLTAAALWLWLALVDGTTGVWQAGSEAGSVGRLARVGLGMALVLACSDALARAPRADGLLTVLPAGAAAIAVVLAGAALARARNAASAASTAGTATPASTPETTPDSGGRRLVAVLRWASVTALISAAALSVPLVFVVVATVTRRISVWVAVPRFARDPLAPWPLPEVPSVSPAILLGAPAALAGAALLGVAAVWLLEGGRSVPAAAGTTMRATRAAAGILIGLAALGGAILSALPLVDTVLLLVLVAAVIAITRWRTRAPGDLRIVAAGTALVGILLLIASAAATHTLWPATTAAAILGILALRWASRAVPLGRTGLRVARPVLAVLALVVLLDASRWVWLWLEGVTTSKDGAQVLVPLALVTLVVLAIAPAVAPRFTSRHLARVESAALASTALLGALAGLVSLATRSTFASAPNSATWATVLAIVGAVALLWLLLPVEGRGPERVVAAALAPAALVGAAVGASTALGLWVDAVAAGGVILLAAFASAALASSRGRRLAWDLVNGLTALLLVPVAFFSDHPWLVLLLVAVAALVTASGDGPVIAGSSARRHVAWVALPLAAGALWSALSERSVALVEAYTLPVAGLLLLLVTAIVLRREPQPRHSTDSPRPDLDGRTALFAAALAIGAVPSMVASSDGSLLRPLLVVVAGCLAAGLVSVLPADFRGLALRLPLVVTAILTVGATGVVRGITHEGAGSRIPGWSSDAWAAGTAVLLLGAAVIWRARRRGAVPTTAAALAAILTFTVPILVLVSAEPRAIWRPIAAAAVLAAAGVVAAAFPAGLAARILRPTAFGAAGLVVVDALFLDVAHHVAFEALTLPLAAALVAAGGLDLRRDEHRRSWPTLGAGLLLGLVPSLLADYVDVSLIRVVALGAAAIAVLLAGVRLHLQAPVLIGGGVVILHALAQVWPGLQVLSTSVPWWLWAGVGGVLLIVVAATYERRIQQARAVTRTLASLR